MKTLCTLLTLVLIAIVVPVHAQNCPPGYTNNGLTCGRGADTINWPSQVADCPAGYTNTGASCLRPAHTISNPSTVADCPAGYTNTGTSCLRPAHTLPNGGSRVADCPAGYRNMGATCQKCCPPKTLGVGSMTCRADEFRSGGRCYKNCPAGYTNNGTTCYRGPSTLGMDSMTCPAGQNRISARCYKPCPSGYTNTGETCYRGPDTLGMSSMTCPAGMFRTGARCYRPCPGLGYTNTGETCYRNPSTLPRNDKINWITPPQIEEQHFYNIGHMTNTEAAARWAVSQGANGVEMDLNFDSSGKPTLFQHNGVCDCSCNSNDATSVCDNGLNNSCSASSGAGAQLTTVGGLPGLALVYIDSKVDKNTNARAGAQVIQLLETTLFATRYEGIVIVAAPSTDDLPYLQSAATEAAKGRHHDRIFFGLDQVRGSASKAIDALKTLTDAPHLVYATGITSCLADTFYSEISGAVSAQVKGETRLTSIWTLDLESSMLNYLYLGVRGIVTNRPGVLARVVRLREPKLTLAAPSYRPRRIGQ